MSESHLHWIDIVVLFVYFSLVMGVGILSMCREKRESVKGYFLAGRTMLWFPIGASLFASNIGSEHFVGLAGSGAASGIAVVAFEWGAVLLLLLLGWVFLPIYLSAGIFTIPEYLQRRFGGSRLRIYLSVLALCLYVVTKCSVDIYAGAVFIQQAIGWNIYVSMVPLLVITAIYTLIGGLAAVVFTDTLQTVVMLVGAITLSIMAFVQVGGLPGLYTKYSYAIAHANTSFSTNSSCSLPRDDAFHIFRDPVNSDLPWPGLLIRSTVASIWAWCADQVIVQRALAAKNMAHAKGATIMAGYLKILPLFLIIFPGMISRVLFTEDVACSDPDVCEKVCGNRVGCSNIAYPKLILSLAPVASYLKMGHPNLESQVGTRPILRWGGSAVGMIHIHRGLRGLMMAVMLAALMSSLTSIFNSAGTVFTMDLWRKIRPRASEKELLLTGRVFIVVLVGISLGWIPLIMGSQEGQLFFYIQAVTGYIAPPICSVFALAIFVPRVNEQGAFWGMVVGQLAGISRLVLDFVYPKPGCDETDERPLIISKVNFTYFSGIVLLITAIVAVVISLMTSSHEQQAEGLTFWSIRRRERNKDKKPTKAEERNGTVTQETYGATKATTTVDGDVIIETSQENYSLSVSPKVNLFLNVNAACLLCVFAFLYGYFS